MWEGESQADYERGDLGVAGSFQLSVISFSFQLTVVGIQREEGQLKLATALRHIVSFRSNLHREAEKEKAPSCQGEKARGRGVETEAGPEKTRLVFDSAENALAG